MSYTTISKHYKKTTTKKDFEKFENYYKKIHKKVKKDTIKHI